MWVITINGKEKEREDIERCLMFFPQFRKDSVILFDAGIIKRIAFDHYEWTKSKTSLAKYFRWIGQGDLNIHGGFWAPVEKVFRVERRSLSRLASKPDESKGFKEIKELVLQYREKARQQEIQDNKDREIFKAIKTLVHKAENEDMKKIRAALERIKIMLT